jgi:hypothetical protein
VPRHRSAATPLSFVLALGLTRAAALAFPQVAIAKVDAAPPLDATLTASGWSQAAAVTLGWDMVRARPASETTTAWLTTDGHALYVRFDAAQREAIAAAQHSNDVGQGNDDAVWIDLWPNGLHGYFYQFQATPIGTHYETSSENTGYAPTWESHGTMHDGGYTVTMRIPLDVLRGVHGGPWKVQFVRYIHSTGEEQVWSYDRTQTSPDDIARAGTMMLPALAGITVARPKPRLAIYGLGEAASKTNGGSTSRTGADVSIPITPTASFYSTFHPDYSNVELDQQSIAPTVVQRFFSEVRPFFTQAASFYDYYNCDACPAINALYTPAIPTPREGYAIEGKQGPFGFASFDAIGDGRSDIASSLSYTTPDTRWFSSVQRVSADLPGVVDDTTNIGTGYTDLKHLSLYFNYGSDSGTNVLVPDRGQYYDLGGGWANQTFGVFAATRKVGAYYNPVDGFVSHPGIAGYALYSAKIWDFDARSKLAAVGIAGFIDRYQGPTQGYAQTDNSLLLDILTKSAFDLQLFSGSNYWRFGTIMTPISQNAGFSLTYHSGLQTNNPGQFPYHGTSSDPTSISYNTGRYGLGRLDTWFRTSTIRAGSRGAFSLAIDDTAQWLPTGHDNIQWFDSLSYVYQISQDSSLAVGVRRVIGEPPIPNGGGNCVGTCSNVSVAYHKRFAHMELYLAYGNPNALTTVPQAIFKLIFYAGAEKGT